MKEKILKVLIFGGISALLFYLGTVIGYNLSLQVQWWKMEREEQQSQELIRQHYLKDTYAGKTPRETLDMFIDALKKGDLDLAILYVEEGRARKDAKTKLEELKEKGYLENKIERLTKVIPCPENEEPPFMPASFCFELRDKDGWLIEDVGLAKNEYNNLWKISSL